MRLKEGFIIYDTGEEQVIVATGAVNFSGLVRSNRTAACIVELLKTEITKDQIVDAMFDKYDAPREQIEKDTAEVLDTLRSIGALDE